MVTDMINSGITEPQINIKKYVMIPPLLVWVGYCSAEAESQCAAIYHVEGDRTCPQRARFHGAIWKKKKPFRWSRGGINTETLFCMSSLKSVGPSTQVRGLWHVLRSHYKSAPIWPASQEQFIPFSATQWVLYLSSSTISSKTGSLVKMDPVSWAQVHCNKPAVFAP